MNSIVRILVSFVSFSNTIRNYYALDVREFWNLYRFNLALCHRCITNILLIRISCISLFMQINGREHVGGIEFPSDNSKARCNPHIKIIISSNLNNRYYEKIVSVIHGVERASLPVSICESIKHVRARFRENLRFIRCNANDSISRTWYP